MELTNQTYSLERLSELKGVWDFNPRLANTTAAHWCANNNAPSTTSQGCCLVGSTTVGMGTHPHLDTVEHLALCNLLATYSSIVSSSCSTAADTRGVVNSEESSGGGGVELPVALGLALYRTLRIFICPLTVMARYHGRGSSPREGMGCGIVPATSLLNRRRYVLQCCVDHSITENNLQCGIIPPSMMLHPKRQEVLLASFLPTEVLEAGGHSSPKRHKLGAPGSCISQQLGPMVSALAHLGQQDVLHTLLTTTCSRGSQGCRAIEKGRSSSIDSVSACWLLQHPALTNTTIKRMAVSCASHGMLWLLRLLLKERPECFQGRHRGVDQQHLREDLSEVAKGSKHMLSVLVQTCVEFDQVPTLTVLLGSEVGYTDDDISVAVNSTWERGYCGWREMRDDVAPAPKEWSPMRDTAPALCHCVSEGMTKCLLEHGAQYRSDTSTTWSPLLDNATVRNQSDKIRVLMRTNHVKDEGKNPSDSAIHSLPSTRVVGETPLHIAATLGNAAAVSVLLQQLRDYDASCVRSPEEQKGKGEQWIHQECHQRGMGTPLMEAVRYGLNDTTTAQVVTLLVEAGSQVDVRDVSTGMSLMHLAVNFGQRLETVKVLLKANVPLDATCLRKSTSSDTMTPRELAEFKLHAGAERMLPAARARLGEIIRLLTVAEGED